VKQVPHPRRCCQGIIFSPPFHDYAGVLELQHQFWRERYDERRPDTLILVEHPPVFTFGRRSRPEHIDRNGVPLKQRGYDVHEVQRGGSVTYHGPGQIVSYPILRLRDFCPGPKTYVRMLEEVVIRVLMEWGIQATRVEKLPGVWVHHDDAPLTPHFSLIGGEALREEHPILFSLPFEERGQAEGEILSGDLRKIAAIGVRISRGITFHGFALNVNTNLEPFELITPCGIEGCQVTSMEMMLQKSVEKNEVRKQITRHFGEVFGIEWIA
jgi:lipoyl(octanoyl) transferase